LTTSVYVIGYLILGYKQVTMANFRCALAEVKPAFGAVVDTLELYRPNGMIMSGPRMEKLMSTCETLVRQVSINFKNQQRQDSSFGKRFRR
jgi:hypothetical protein